LPFSLVSGQITITTPTNQSTHTTHHTHKQTHQKSCCLGEEAGGARAYDAAACLLYGADYPFINFKGEAPDAAVLARVAIKVLRVFGEDAPADVKRWSDYALALEHSTAAAGDGEPVLPAPPPLPLPRRVPPGAKSDFVGVSVNNGAWVARIEYNDKGVNLGR
jgi:hypothetical protein